MNKMRRLLLLLAVLAVFPLLAQAASTCNVTSGGCNLNTSGESFPIVNSTSTYGKPVYMGLAYATGCPHCDALDNFIANLSIKYDIKVTYINAISDQSELSGLINSYNVSQQYWGQVPILFVNGKYCAGDTGCEAFLERNISAYAISGTPKINVTGSSSFGTVSVIEFTGLALVDSINPCAFAVLIFFLSALFMQDPDKRYRILLGGLSFAAGIFFFYLVVGILLLAGIKSALALADLKSIYVYGAFGVVSIALGLLNLSDYFLPKGHAIKIPENWKPHMTNLMKRYISVPSGFVAGIIVTAFLLPCITGPYFIAGSLLKNMSLGSAIPWLAYYDFIFVLPMMIITALVFASYTSVEKAKEFKESNKKKLRLIAGILLIIVGVSIFLQILGIL